MAFEIPGELMERSEARKAVVLLIVAHNIVQNSVLNKRGYVAGNLVMSGILVAIAQSSDLTLSQIGLSLRLKRHDLRTSAIAAAIVTGGSLVALARPRTRELLRDERARDTESCVIAYKSLVRFPIGTALFEETTFRGVLPALTGRSNAVGDVVSAGAFGLWHLIPTARALTGSPLGREMTPAGRARAVVVGCAASSLAGLGFSWLRGRSGTIALPWLVHSAFNTITYLAGVIAWRFGDHRS